MKITYFLGPDFEVFKDANIIIKSSPNNDNNAILLLSKGNEFEEILILNPSFNFIHDENEQRTIQIHGFYSNANGVLSSLRIWCQYD